MKTKDAAEKQNGAHDQIRLPENAHHQIAQQEHHQQDDGDLEDPAFLLKGLQASHISGEADETVDVVYHQSRAAEYHAVDQPLQHIRQPPFIGSWAYSYNSIVFYHRKVRKAYRNL